MDEIDRERPSCPKCHSTVRFRSIVHLLSTALFSDSKILKSFPRNKSIVGIGLSDAPLYAQPLDKKLDYTNTFFHKEPFIDITTPPVDLKEKLDFIISSDVFEHIPHPVSRAFEASYSLLKPGGHLILTVPFRNSDETQEHFPDLHEYEIFDFKGDRILVNRDIEGNYKTYSGLVFHGGDGTTLEMRVFCRKDIEAQLISAGFEEITFFEQPVSQYGIYHRVNWSLPILARKPQ